MSLEDRLASQPSGMIGVIVKVKALSATGKQKAVSIENSKSMVLDLVKLNLQSKLSKAFEDQARTYKNIDYVATQVDEAALKVLQSSKMVAGIYYDSEMKINMSSSNVLTGASRMHSSGLNGAGVSVAVLDTGVQADHPALSANIVGLYCTTDDCDEDPNNKQYSSTGGMDCPIDNGCIHGTHVSGIIAGNSNSYKGVAPETGIYSIRVFPKQNGRTRTSFILSALDHILEVYQTHNIVAVNMSLGGGKHSKICDDSEFAYYEAFRKLRQRGLAVFVATGNDEYDKYIAAPACVSGAIRVGASSKGDAIAEFSNQVNWIRFMAPGVAIHAPISKSQYEYLNGTSMATPNVAGAYALLKAAHSDESIESILAAMYYSASFLSDDRAGADLARFNVDVAHRSLQGNRLAYLGDPSEPEMSNYISFMESSRSTVTDHSGAFGGDYLSGLSEIKIVFEAPKSGEYILRYHHPIPGMPSDLMLAVNSEPAEMQRIQSGGKYTNLIQFNHKGTTEIVLSSTRSFYLDRVEFISLGEELPSIFRSDFNSTTQTESLVVQYAMRYGSGSLRLKKYESYVDKGLEFRWYKDGKFLEETETPQLQIVSALPSKKGNYQLVITAGPNREVARSEEVYFDVVDPTRASLLQFKTKAGDFSVLQVLHNGSTIYEEQIKFEEQIHNVVVEQLGVSITDLEVVAF